MGLAFRVPEIKKYPEEHYWLHIVPPLGLYIGSKQIKPFSKKVYINKDSKWPYWHKIKINVHELSIEVYIENMEIPVLNAQDDIFKEAGFLGIMSFHFPNYWCFDNMYIYPHNGTVITDRINQDRTDINHVKMNWEDFIPSKEQSINYYASNDGGKTWMPITKKDTYHTFPTSGSVLRVKAEFNTTNDVSPILQFWSAGYR